MPVPANPTFWTQMSSNASIVPSAGETDQDLDATQFTKNCIAYNIIKFKYYKFKTIECFRMF
jgi:hypothetical protein